MQRCLEIFEIFTSDRVGCKLQFGVIVCYIVAKTHKNTQPKRNHSENHRSTKNIINPCVIFYTYRKRFQSLNSFYSFYPLYSLYSLYLHLKGVKALKGVKGLRRIKGVKGVRRTAVRFLYV